MYRFLCDFIKESFYEFTLGLNTKIHKWLMFLYRFLQVKNAYVNVCCDKTRLLVSLHWIYTLLTRACFQEFLVQSSYENTQHKLYKVGQI